MCQTLTAPLVLDRKHSLPDAMNPGPRVGEPGGDIGPTPLQHLAVVPETAHLRHPQIPARWLSFLTHTSINLPHQATKMAPIPMEDNRTIKILRKAHNEGYGVVSQVRSCRSSQVNEAYLFLRKVIYDYAQALSSVRCKSRTARFRSTASLLRSPWACSAAERMKSPMVC